MAAAAMASRDARAAGTAATVTGVQAMVARGVPAAGTEAIAIMMVRAGRGRGVPAVTRQRRPPQAHPDVPMVVSVAPDAPEVGIVAMAVPTVRAARAPIVRAVTASARPLAPATPDVPTGPHRQQPRALPPGPIRSCVRRRSRAWRRPNAASATSTDASERIDPPTLSGLRAPVPRAISLMVSPARR